MKSTCENIRELWPAFVVPVLVATLAIVTTGCSSLPIDADAISPLPDIVMTSPWTNTAEEASTDQAGGSAAPETTRSEPAAPSYSGQSDRKPSVTRYVFTFEDGSTIEFRDYTVGDFWGGTPAAGWGRRTIADGTVESLDVNSLIRRPYILRQMAGEVGGGLAVTLQTHGDRYYWTTANGKKVDIYADGWSPHVERMVDAETQRLGWAPITKATATVEKWQ